MKKLAILFTLLTLTLVTYGNTDTTAEARVWKLEDKSVVARGIFLKAIAGEIFIQEATKVVSFSIESLSWVDQKHVNQQLKAMEAAQQKSITSLFSWKSIVTTSLPQTFIMAALLLSLGLRLIWLSHKRNSLALHNLH